MKKNNNFITAFTVMSAIFVLVGLFLVLQPEISEQIMGWIVGMVFVIYGIIKVFGYIFNIGLKSESSFNLISGLLNAGIGMYIIMNHGSVLSFATVITGITICFESIMRIITAFEMKKSQYSDWQKEMTSSVISLVISVILIIMPFNTVLTAYRLIGIALIANGIFRFVSAYRISKISSFSEDSVIIETTAVIEDTDETKDE